MLAAVCPQSSLSGAMLDERLDCRVRVVNASRPVTVRCSRKGRAAQIVAAVQVQVGMKQQRAEGATSDLCAHRPHVATAGR
jgi:hypothetical protein